MANRTALNPQLIEQLTRPMREHGLPGVECARLLHIPDKTFYGWCARGRSHAEKGQGSIYRELTDAIAHAQSQFHEALLRNISKKARLEEGGGRYLTWLAEKKYPKLYGNVVRVEVNKEVDRILDAVEAVVDPQTYAKILARIESGAASGTETPAEVGEVPSVH